MIVKNERMVSWWLRPWHCGSGVLSTAVKDELRRRADIFATGNVGIGIIFGAHFRWDFAGGIDRIHEIIRFSAEELHQRGIQLWDHHSSVLSCCYNRDPNRFAHTDSNFGQLLTRLPGIECYDNLHDDWKMIDVTTGKPAFLTGYAAQEFCMNSPEFTAAYCTYLKQLVADTGIDGLMSDDAFFYPRFHACGCRHCRAKFGRELPPVSDLNFWGNWNNPDFLAWIKFRFDTVTDFNCLVAAALPEDFPLMNCCSGTVGSGASENAMAIENFLVGSNCAMLEMCGNTPGLDGSYTNRLCVQLHQIAAAKCKGATIFGLGYGFSESTANFIWAFNKFLGSAMWFSQIIARMGLDDDVFRAWPRTASFVGTAFAAEKKFQEWFDTAHKAKIALLYSRETQMTYGGCNFDYPVDYNTACKWLFEHGYDFDVVLSIADATEYPVLILTTAAHLSKTDMNALAKRKGTTYACGPLDGVEVPRIEREPEWPANTYCLKPIFACKTPGGWREIQPDFHWHPSKMSSGNVEFPIAIWKDEEVPAGWYVRSFKDKAGAMLKHYLASGFVVGRDEKSEALRHYRHNTVRSGMAFISTLSPKPRAMEIAVPNGVEVLEPLSGRITRCHNDDNAPTKFNPPEDCYYFIVRY